MRRTIAHSIALGIAGLLLIIGDVAAQVIVMSGVASNLGRADAPGPELSGRLQVMLGAGLADSAVLTIGPPLGGSGHADFRCWTDGLVLLSRGAEGTNIAWLGRFEPAGVKGEYFVAGGVAEGQGGLWSATLGDSELRGLRSNCRSQLRPLGVDELVDATTSLRRQWAVLGARPWFVDSAPTPQELGHFEEVRTEVSALMVREMSARGLVPLLEQYVTSRNLTNDQALAAGQALVGSGMLRLPPEEQLERFRAFGKLFMAMSESECRRWAGLESSFQNLYFLGRLSEQEQRDHAAWQAHALDAELSASRPAVAQSQDTEKLAVERIADNMGDLAGEMFLNALVDYENLLPSGKCWAETAIVGAILAEESDVAAVLASTYFLWISQR